MSNEQPTATKPNRRTVEDQKAEIKKKMEQLSARMAKLDAQTREKQRMEDTRAKIVIGSLVLAGIAEGDEARRKWLTGALAKLQERDRRIVEAAMQRAVDRRPPAPPSPATPPTKGPVG